MPKSNPIRKHRVLAGLSVNALAKATGVFPETLYRWERETQIPHESSIGKLAAALAKATKGDAEKLYNEMHGYFYE